MKAFLLAAGKGTRLQPYTENLPKCLIPICGRPLLDIWIDLFEKNGINEILVNTHHLADQVEQFLVKKRQNTGVNVFTVHENKLLGSAGTILSNKDFVQDDEDFIIAYADNLTNINFRKFMRFHEKVKSFGGLLSMALFNTPDPSACGIASLDESKKIIDFIEKPENPDSSLANAGIYIATHKIFDFFPEKIDVKNNNKSCTGPALDFGHNILPGLSGLMYGYELEDFLIDIGTIKTYNYALKKWSDKERKH